MSSLTFVHVGDLEPNFRSTAPKKIRGEPNPIYRSMDEVEAVFDCMEHLFDGLRGPGPAGLQKPDVVFFSGDLWGPYPRPGVGSGGADGYRGRFERLFAIWQKLVDAGTAFVWTVASHEYDQYRNADAGQAHWPFEPGPTPTLVRAPGVRITGDPGSPLVLEIRGVKVAGIGGLGGQLLQNPGTRAWARNEDKAARRQAEVDERRKRLDRGIARLRMEAPRVVVSADDQRRGLQDFADYVGLGGIQSTAGRAPVHRSKVHTLGRPVKIGARDGKGAPPSQRLARMDFVWGESTGTTAGRVLRVLCPAPPQHPDAPAHPKVVAWGAVPWTPSPPSSSRHAPEDALHGRG